MLSNLPRRFISVQAILHAVRIGKIGELDNVFDLMQTLRRVRNSLETELSELGYGTYVHRGPTASWSEDDTETLSLIVEEILSRCGAYTKSLPLYDFYPSVLGTNAEKIFLSIPMSVLRGKCDLSFGPNTRSISWTTAYSRLSPIPALRQRSLPSRHSKRTADFPMFLK